MQDVLGNLPMKLMWFLHEVRNHANYKSYVKVCMCQVDETPNQLSIQCSINKWSGTLGL